MEWWSRSWHRHLWLAVNPNYKEINVRLPSESNVEGETHSLRFRRTRRSTLQTFNSSTTTIVPLNVCIGEYDAFLAENNWWKWRRSWIWYCWYTVGDRWAFHSRYANPRNVASSQLSASDRTSEASVQALIHLDELAKNFKFVSCHSPRVPQDEKLILTHYRSSLSGGWINPVRESSN